MRLSKRPKDIYAVHEFNRREANKKVKIRDVRNKKDLIYPQNVRQRNKNGQKQSFL
jgi:hypothetical protein